MFSIEQPFLDACELNDGFFILLFSTQYRTNNYTHHSLMSSKRESFIGSRRHYSSLLDFSCYFLPEKTQFFSRLTCASGTAFHPMAPFLSISLGSDRVFRASKFTSSKQFQSKNRYRESKMIFFHRSFPFKKHFLWLWKRVHWFQQHYMHHILNCLL